MKYTSRERSSDKKSASIVVSDICKWQVITDGYIVKTCVLESGIT